MSLAFGFVLGVFATFAEPAIAVLQQAGAAVRPDQAPLLYTLLNPTPNPWLYRGYWRWHRRDARRSSFYKSWSLKPFIYAGVLTLSAITLYFQFEPSGTLSPVLGLAGLWGRHNRTGDRSLGFGFGNRRLQNRVYRRLEQHRIRCRDLGVLIPHSCGADLELQIVQHG